ncbi:hypothetical protein N7532_001908 [Penicillium argentinense]|uniref:Uncharacterized protein n=1 Tax=Penicillium argentinense TaxID=1131581 RepID=A0A9W9KMW1_9EURO|nr:uncharacterized protein N7532_001908 [Penicillium argentinense]KAJ5111373.1 hypothetical protein N7532_001908 [Penicillium argentinense]
MSARTATLRVFWHRCAGAPLRPNLQTQMGLSWRSFASKGPHGTPTPNTKNLKPASQAARQAQRVQNTVRTTQMKAGNIGQLALKVARQGEVVLFNVRSQRSYVLSAYGLSAFCFAYAVYNSNAVFRDPVTVLPVWQQALFGGICVTMSVMGTIFFTRTSHMIRNITAVKSQGQTYIRFTVRRLMPFTKPYQFEVLPSQVAISKRLVVSEQTAKRFENESRKLGPEEETTPGFFKAPVEKLSRGLWRLFLSVRQVFTSEDFILMRVEGRNATFRLDSNGYVSSDLYALGNPVKFTGK